MHDLHETSLDEGALLDLQAMPATEEDADLGGASNLSVALCG